MLRQPAINETTEQLALIKSNAAVIQAKHPAETIDSLLALLLNALDEFEAHRTSDYIRQDNRRAKLALHATSLYYTHLHDHLREADCQNELTVIYSNLLNFAKGIMAHYNTIELERDNLASVRRQVTETLLNSHDINDYYSYYGVADVFREMDAADEAAKAQVSFDNAVLSWINPLFSEESDITIEIENESTSLYSGESRSMSDSNPEKTSYGVTSDSDQSSEKELSASDDTAEMMPSPIVASSWNARHPSSLFSSPLSPERNTMSYNPTSRTLFSDSSDEDFACEENSPIQLRRH